MLGIGQKRKMKESERPSREAAKVKHLMRKYTPALNKAILSRNNHFSIASELYNENVISEGAYSGTHQIEDGEMTKVVHLITAARVAVEKDPEMFPVVMAAMKKHTPVDDVVDKMENEYCTCV